MLPVDKAGYGAPAIEGKLPTQSTRRWSDRNRPVLFLASYRMRISKRISSLFVDDKYIICYFLMKNIYLRRSFSLFRGYLDLFGVFKHFNIICRCSWPKIVIR